MISHKNTMGIRIMFDRIFAMKIMTKTTDTNPSRTFECTTQDGSYVQIVHLHLVATEAFYWQ